jgi:hypothetical protein
MIASLCQEAINDELFEARRLRVLRCVYRRSVELCRRSACSYTFRSSAINNGASARIYPVSHIDKYLSIIYFAM